MLRNLLHRARNACLNLLHVHQSAASSDAHAAERSTTNWTYPACVVPLKYSTYTFCCCLCCSAEYTAAEVSQGLHTNSLKFAFESKSERGWANQAKDVDPARPVHVKAGTA